MAIRRDSKYPHRVVWNVITGNPITLICFLTLISGWRLPRPSCLGFDSALIGTESGKEHLPQPTSGGRTFCHHLMSQNHCLYYHSLLMSFLRPNHPQTNHHHSNQSSSPVQAATPPPLPPPSPASPFLHPSAVQFPGNAVLYPPVPASSPPITLKFIPGQMPSSA